MKEGLLATIEAARVREGELEALCVDAPADPGGRWNAKDHLAHASWWRSRNAKLLDAVRTGSALPPPLEDDPQNAEIYAATRDWPAARVKADAHASWNEVAAAVSACTDEDLARAHPYAAGFPMWDAIAANAHRHLAQHLTFWHLEHGDEAKAEAAQIWAREVDDAAFPGQEPRASSAYNLACFYARLGRSGPALPLLREAFAGAPRLAEWARKDTDLDPIRDEPAIEQLLG